MQIQTQATVNKEDNSLIITLPSELIEKLNIAEGDTLIITENIDSFILRKHNSKLEGATKNNQPENEIDDTPDELVLEGIKEGLKQAINGETIPLSQMWEGIDVE